MVLSWVLSFLTSLKHLTLLIPHSLLSLSSPTSTAAPPQSPIEHAPLTGSILGPLLPLLFLLVTTRFNYDLYADESEIHIFGLSFFPHLLLSLKGSSRDEEDVSPRYKVPSMAEKQQDQFGGTWSPHLV